MLVGALREKVGSGGSAAPIAAWRNVREASHVRLFVALTGSGSPLARCNIVRRPWIATHHLPEGTLRGELAVPLSLPCLLLDMSPLL